ncbi:hypothetical protein AAES_62244 [Amazona aestiva]|uniref:Uncharacterized protein n=1 Tax=Amazona aestiva TaxID=12930 RepID=A0A0Q3RDG9_AMAAE|nr:hypothetical protein AAES_62244 [Amazona aestiva]
MKQLVRRKSLRMPTPDLQKHHEKEKQRELKKNEKPLPSLWNISQAQLTNQQLLTILIGEIRQHIISSLGVTLTFQTPEQFHTAAIERKKKKKKRKKEKKKKKKEKSGKKKKKKKKETIKKKSKESPFF